MEALDIICGICFLVVNGHNIMLKHETETLSVSVVSRETHKESN